MVSTLIALLILIIILGLLYWCIQQLPIPAPMAQAAQVVFVLICIVVLLGVLFGWFPLPRL